jgi:NAD(P)-dependent dehydrogenase (short-subunit alcohol dehydrogenase family)
MLKLTDKVAVITGGNSGIGAATAKLFAQQGAAVALVARRADKLAAVADEIIAAGGQALCIPGDVTDPATAEAVCAETVKQFGRIDILVNSAGIGDYTRPITGVTDEFFDEIVKTDQYGVFYMFREALKYMAPAHSGVIVNVGSVGGVFHNSGFAYAAAKSAVIGMTRNMAMQFAAEGIRVNAVCPGGTDTPMIQAMMDPAQQLPCDQEFSKITACHFNYKLPLCTPEEQANTILFLASDEASGITGQYLVVDHGGWI